ncbi:hypothetical protein DRL78_26400, partial [Salmonella enterica subsp. enterica serovar Hadar]|nr:hypothetical protein [Salmonella enterica subsp. enterica serovar Hadar]
MQGRWAAEPGKARIIGKTNLQKRALRLRVERSACQFARLRLLSKDARAGLVAPRLWCGERLGTLPLFFALGAWQRLCDETSGKGVGIWNLVRSGSAVCRMTSLRNWRR